MSIEGNEEVGPTMWQVTVAKGQSREIIGTTFKAKLGWSERKVFIRVYVSEEAKKKEEGGEKQEKEKSECATHHMGFGWSHPIVISHVAPRNSTVLGTESQTFTLVTSQRLYAPRAHCNQMISLRGLLPRVTDEGVTVKSVEWRR